MLGVPTKIIERSNQIRKAWKENQIPLPRMDDCRKKRQNDMEKIIKTFYENKDWKNSPDNTIRMLITDLQQSFI